ncbi:AbrB/MazE/SpoVT family DNA-binding domain-containing protein [Allosphingosinicella indica]|uniref:AbrB/MazE/SpoVT family DNA-binding domain-containing protein n=1 Tax=Allosphingosinicella indica TaxID=941907 RepID=UPI001FCD761A|nr:AbrB/MazE/SpoVT family DNA-binding domain-containing protein [Allosphingosinicella indica]
MSAKGQIVIPKAVRERMKWAQGDDLEIVETAGGLLLRPRTPRRETITLEEFRRRVPRHEGPAVSLEEMEKAIDEAMAERWKRKEADSR